MLLRLRHAFPILQTLSGGWAASALVPPLVRPFARVAAVANSGAAASDSGPLSPEPSAPSAGQLAEEPKKKRRSTTGSRSKSKAAAAAPAAPEAEAAAADTPSATATVAADDPTTSTAQSAPKRRATSRRKAAGAAAADGTALQAAGEQPGQELQLEGEGGTATPPPAPAKRSRRKKAEETLMPQAEAAPASEAPAEVAEASGSKKRAIKRVSRKAAAAEPEVEAEAQENIIESLPYEPFLILPRKAEEVLIALGARQRLGPAPAAGGGVAAADPEPRALRNIGQIAEFMQLRQPRELSGPLLVSMYQGYLGKGVDLLFDLFCLDFGGDFLPSEAVMGAALEAGRASTRSPLTASGMPSEKLLEAARERLARSAGPEALAAQERTAPLFADAQLTLFLLDWASSTLAGPRRPEDDDVRFAARRCAALQLTKPVALERLDRYVRGGAGLAELAAAGGRGGGGGGGGRAVRLAQPMDALLEGLKAGVRLDRERLLADFWLGSPDPLRPHLPELMRRIEQLALTSFDPGSKSYYDTLVGKLRAAPQLAAAIQQQEALWERETGDRDGSTLTVMQARLLFHLWRRDRFSTEQQRPFRFRETDQDEAP